MKKALLLAITSAGVFAQQQAPPIVSPEVHADKRVTFRFRAPNAKEVFVMREGGARDRDAFAEPTPFAMQKDENGVWSLTTDVLEPDYYEYRFVADGASYLDPQNPLMMPNLLDTASMVYVPGQPTHPWEVTNVPRGIVHHHFYRSGIVGDDRDYFVYTPPGYDPKASRTYPVLYLLHGFSDGADAWSAVGRAHVIVDNLIAQGKAKPMLLVMPLGYGDLAILSRAAGARDPAVLQRSFERYRDSLFQEVMPEIEKSYRAAKDRGSRAIAGLSMGGDQSLTFGLNAIDRFAWIGAFSPGEVGNYYAETFLSLDAKVNDKLRLLWIACGVDDRRIASIRQFIEFLKSRGVKHSWKETAGAHSWIVWRRYLAEFAPLLFN